jgi:NADH-quinone oxidoreductase subunit N
MNYSLISLEFAVVSLGIVLLIVDWRAPEEIRRKLGYVAALGLGFVFLFSCTSLVDRGTPETAFGGMFVQDGVALFFKRLFLVAAILVLVLSVEFSNRFATGITEYYVLILFALAGMMFAASANDFSLLFVSVELITVTFYVLTSYQRGRIVALEAGVKYLILGAVASAFLVYGIALVYGTTGHLQFREVAAAAKNAGDNPLFLAGMLLVLAGLGFKIATFPAQIWTPDVYQGAPTPTAAFLAIGSKAAGFVLLLRVLFTAVPDLAQSWHRLLIVIAAVTILYGNLCAIPQRNLKRLLGYSSIAHAGYLMLGVAALSPEGQSAVLFYLATYLFAVLAAFFVIGTVFQQVESEDVDALAGLHQRAPLMATALTLSLVSLAGVPPLAGFFGKFALLKAVLARGDSDPAYYALVAVTLAGVVISLYYYFAVIRTIYWGPVKTPEPGLEVSRPLRYALVSCVVGMLWLGVAPGGLINLSQAAVAWWK